YTVVEFQFIKPGKGAAFTRTKFKNLLTGAVIERNIRSGEKLEPANVEEKTMQYLYREGEDLVFMDEKDYTQVHVEGEMVGGAARDAGPTRAGDRGGRAGPHTPLVRGGAHPDGDDPTRASEVGRLGGGRRGMLAARARMMAALREFFAGRDFLEVETPLLVP